MEKEMERKMINMSKELKNIQALIQTTHFSDNSLGYLGDYYIDTIIETACEVMGE